MTPTELLLTILFSPISLAAARAIRPRERRGEPQDERGWVRGLVALVLPTIIWAFWIFFEDSRTVVGGLVLLIVPCLWLPVSAWSRTLRNVGLALLAFLLPPGFLIPLLESFMSSRLTRTAISPDGRWELRCYDEYGSWLTVAPRGLATWDPRAYPSRRLVSFGSGSAPERIEWTGPREITATRIGPGGETPRVSGNLGFRVVIHPGEDASPEP